MEATARSRGRYRDALRVAEFRALIGALSVSTAGISITAVALTILVYERTSSPLLASLAFALGFLPYLLGGIFLSALVDRIPARNLLTGCAIGSAVLIGVMAWPATPVPVLLALLFVAGVLASVSNGSRGALVRSLVPETTYVPARALLRIASQVAQIAGNAGGGILLVVVTPHQAMLVTTGAFLASAALTHFGMRRHPVAATARTPLFKDSFAGVHAVFAGVELRRLLLLGWLVPTFAVAPEALAAPYVDGQGGSSVFVGLWLVALPIGMIAGDLVGVWFLSPAGQRRSVALLAAATFVPLLAFAFHPPILGALALLVLSGLCASYSLGLDQRVRDVAPPSLFARAMTVNMAGLMTMQGLGFAVAGGAAQVVGPSVAIALAGICGLLTVVLLKP